MSIPTKKPKVRQMKLEIACTRKGAATHGYKLTWQEPEEKAIETYNHFLECLTAMAKAHGLLKE